MQKTILMLGLVAQVQALELGSVSEAEVEATNEMPTFS